MLLLCPEIEGRIILEKGFFISAEMGKLIAAEMAQGKLKFNEKIVPVHLPYTGLHSPFFGSQNHNKADLEEWRSLNLPRQYQGENLDNKKLIVFPMHSLGDQLYLAVAIRALIERYANLQVTIAKSRISSSEQWYPYIYGEHEFTLDGPMILPDVMRQHDFYVDAEFFAHHPEFNNSYPPDFFMTLLFHHSPVIMKHKRPRIASYDMSMANLSRPVLEIKKRIAEASRPCIFISSMTNGRVRDLPEKVVLEFIDIASEHFFLIVSTHKRPSLDMDIKKRRQANVVTTENVIESPKDLFDLIRLSDYVITTDSGITHISEGLEKPCGTIFNVVSPHERTEPYQFSESMMIDFEMPEVCKTPCYVHALKKDELCPGMSALNSCEGAFQYYDYPPCMEHLRGSHLMQLLDALIGTFG